MNQANKKPDNSWVQEYVDHVNAYFTKEEKKAVDRKKILKKELDKKSK